jgi:hypothetical protein
MFQRLASHRLADLARRFPAVVVLGPRQPKDDSRMDVPDLPYPIAKIPAPSF